MQTPKVIKVFITLIIFLSLFSGICDKIFPSSLHLPFLMWSLTITAWGIKHFFLWQLVSHAFIYPSFGGLSPGFLINLAFSMLIIWRIGSSICQYKGVRHFCNLFLGGSIASGLASYIALSSTQSSELFAGAGPAIFALLVAAVMLYPEMEVMLFLTIPVKGKWLIVGILASLLLIDLSNGFYVNFFANSSAFLFGYLYAIFAWKLKSPFTSLNRFEEILLKIPSLHKAQEKDLSSIDSYASRSKIYDFKTGKVLLDDDTFIEACLAKIAKEGRQSLSLLQKFRLWRISKKKKERS